MTRTNSRRSAGSMLAGLVLASNVIVGCSADPLLRHLKSLISGDKDGDAFLHSQVMPEHEVHQGQSVPIQDTRADSFQARNFDDNREPDYEFPEGADVSIMPSRLLDEILWTFDAHADVIEPLFGPYNSSYNMNDFLVALNISYDWDVNIEEHSDMDRNGNRRNLASANDAANQGIVSNLPPTASPTSAMMDLGGERDAATKGRVQYAMAHMALLLGQSFSESMETGMCDEQNTAPTDKVNPSCGQNGDSYRYPSNQQLGTGDYTCFANDDEWRSGYRFLPDVTDPERNMQFLGCPLQPDIDKITGKGMPSHRYRDEYQQLPMQCGTEARIGTRDCCWWGRGMLQMNKQCDYGHFQMHWGSYYDIPDRRDMDICSNPAQVCDDGIPELRYLTGLFLWVRDVVHGDLNGFNFMQELKQWVDSGMQDMAFVDRIGGVLVNGDPANTPPDAQARRFSTKAALEAIMALPAWGTNQHYGNVAQCKPAVQSSIYKSEYNFKASNAVDGMVSSHYIASTNCDASPFWEVDLGQEYFISTVNVVWHETYHYEMIDLAEDEAIKEGMWDEVNHVYVDMDMTKNFDPIVQTNRNLQIDLLDVNGNNVGSLDQSRAQHNMQADGAIESVWTKGFSVAATKVRITAPSQPDQCDFLSLAEVQVMSTCAIGDACLTHSTCEEVNLAKCKPTSQSSTLNDAPVSASANAVQQNEAVSNTACEEDPWWMVDLMGPFNVSAVALINIPSDNALDRMDGVVVELLDEDFNVIAEDHHKPALLNDRMGDVYVLDFDDESSIAHHVRVWLHHNPGNCEELKLTEVAVMGHCIDEGQHCIQWPMCNYENAAECMPAMQSSTLEDGFATRAVDGHESLAHTTCQADPWWEVDLMGNFPVTDVILHNRHDCCFDRLNGVSVELLDPAGNVVTEVRHNPATEGVPEDSWTARFAASPNEAVVASRVRIMLDTPADAECQILNLADVLVMTPCAADDANCITWPAYCDEGNIAQCKPATQSSTIYGETARNAVDGGISLAHTDCESNPWWEVDLMDTRKVTGVAIHNREDVAKERLNGILVELKDEMGNTLASVQHDPSQEGIIEHMWIARFNNADAFKVRVSTQHGDACEFLNLAEVMVIGDCLPGDECLTGYGCDHGNIARCKPAKQSSTLKAPPGSNQVYAGVAGDANDGHESTSSTECENNPWWTVTLGDKRAINIGRREIHQVVVIPPEGEEYNGRLNGVIVDLLDKEENIIDRKQHDPAVDGDIGFMWRVDYPAETYAWYVRVSLVFPPGECGFLKIAELQVFSPCMEGDACMDPTFECFQGDVAQCKPARQISTVKGNIARHAVHAGQGLAHTDCEQEPWWETDLQGPYFISEVVIFNRLDCCQERLENVIVELVGVNGETVKAVQHDPITDGPVGEMWVAKFNNFDDIAYKVRVHLINEIGECQFLNLADVQVYSTCKVGDACARGISCEHMNVARCKPAEQSSTRQGAVADWALDGEESLSMTECENNPWWSVDLVNSYQLSEVQVFNRRDCCWERLNNALIELFDENGNLVDSAQHDPVTMGPIKDVWVAKFDYERITPIRVVRVSIQHEPDTCNFLELAEVQVMGVCQIGDACDTESDCEHSNSVYIAS